MLFSKYVYKYQIPFLILLKIFAIWIENRNGAKKPAILCE